MSLAIIQRLTISCCGRRKIDVDVCRRIASSWHFMQKKPSTEYVKSFAHHAYAVHTRLYHGTLLLYTDKLKDDENVTGDISTLQIKKRSPRRNKAVIKDDQTPKNDAWNVKALATAEEYNLEGLADGLLKQQLYIPRKISTSTNCEYCLFCEIA